MLVFDATPLIYLGKVDRLSVLDEWGETCTVPELVHEEVVTEGNAEGYADARRVAAAIESGIFEVRDTPETTLRSRLEAETALSAADASVLALAAETGGAAVMDEAYGREIADVEGIETRGTAYLVLRSLRDGAIDAAEARETIDAIVEAGWYCSTEAYAEILQRIETLS